MKDKEYIELFKIWFPTSPRIKDSIAVKQFAKEYNNFKIRFQKQMAELDESFVGSIPR